MKTTIKDIARLANVSVATVSRVINNKPKGVSDATRQRIWEIVERENFKPSAYARGLVTRSSNILGVIVPDIANEYWTRLARGIEEAASARGYNTILCDGQNSPEKEAMYLNFLSEHYVSGILYSNIKGTSESSFAMIKRSKVPTIFIDTWQPLPSSHNVYSNNEEAFNELVHYVYSKGHRRLAFIGGYVESNSTRERYKGYIRALKELDLPFDKTLIVHDDFTIEGGRRGIGKLLEQKADFTAAMCCNDLMAAGVYAELDRRGIRVPEDISVTGFDDLPLASLLKPKLTTVSQSNIEMGKKGANLLIDMIEGKAGEGSIDDMVRCELAVRESVLDLNQPR